MGGTATKVTQNPVADYNMEKDDFQPRPYQQQMKEVCMKKNTIIYLPTGAGKTYIVLMVMKEMLKDLEKPLTEGGKRMFFLVNTVALAKQQALFFARNLPCKVSVYTSDLNVDAWKNDRWLEEFSKNQILVCTCQILLNILKHGYLSLKHINLLIFDECHHGLGEHPMHNVMSEFAEVEKSFHPRVIGMTGMLLFQEPKFVEDVTDKLMRMENVYHATIATVGNYDEYTAVCEFSTNPKENIIFYSNPPLPFSWSEILHKVKLFTEKIMQFDTPKFAAVNTKTLAWGPTKPIKKVKKCFNEIQSNLKELGLFGASIAVLGMIVQFEIDKRMAENTQVRMLYRACISFCEQLRHQMLQLMNGFTLQDQVKTFSSPRLLKFIQYLELEYNTSLTVEKQMLVFVERRFTAKVLYHVTKLYFQASSHGDEPTVKPDFIVGQNASIPESIEKILETKSDRKVLDRFHRKAINVLFSTSVLEEGIDLQMCNRVIKFDAPRSFASYQQSKGRARMKESLYVIMIDEDEKTKFLTKVKLYRAIEVELQKQLIGKTINRPEPLEKDIYTELYNVEIEPFYTPIGAKLDALGSVNILNRYCMALPNDMFTTPSVVWKRVDLHNQYVMVSIVLPLQSTVREEIFGNQFKSLRLAKRSAAFNACKRLHENKELDDHLLPVTSKKRVEAYHDRYFSKWKTYSNDNPRTAGTNHNKRSYRIKYAEQSCGSFPQVNKMCYIYILKIWAEFGLDAKLENVNTFRSLYNSRNNFGIMTTKPLPKLARMKFFVTLGMIGAQLMLPPIEVQTVTQETLLALKNFHLVIFRNILKVWKQYGVLDPNNEENSFLIVPMLDSQEIDFKLLEKFQYLKEPSESSMKQRQIMQFRKEDYNLRVIHPWYKHDVEQNYVVTKVHEELTPGSKFPNEQYSTYENYFTAEHMQYVVNKEQFLIEVKGITTHLNRLHPGNDEQGRSAKAKHWEFQEILIPELCHNYEFPADYWLKATLLPSALHRIHYLLLAEAIRLDFAQQAGIGTEDCEDCDDLHIDRHNLKSPSKPEEFDAMQIDDSDESDCMTEYDETDIASFRESALKQNTNDLNAEIDSLGDLFNSVLPWSKKEEPVVISRNWDSVGKFDIQYYTMFLERFADTATATMESVTDTYGAEQAQQSLTSLPKPTLELCDVPTTERNYIKLLNMSTKDRAKVCLQQADIIKALTCASAGDVFDLERFEMLGDAFLKFSVSIYLLGKHPDWHEGHLTACKAKMVSNRNLLYCATDYGLPGMLNVLRFEPKSDWMPPLCVVQKDIQIAMVEANESAALLYQLQLTESEIRSGDIESEKKSNFCTLLNKQNEINHSPLQSVIKQQTISDKVPADSLEALIGICVASVGVQDSFKCLTHFGIFPKKENLSYLLSSPLLTTKRRLVSEQDLDNFLINPVRIEKLLGYTFKNRVFLLQALTHASFPTNRITGSYQQLEFLGDAVLDFLVSAYIYERNPHMSPGQLTDLRSALVNNVTLACILVRKGLHRYILSESPYLTNAISRFISIQEKYNYRTGAHTNFLVEESNASMAEHIEVPKVLGDILESIIGAVFVDSDSDLLATWNVIFNLLKEEVEQFSQNTPLQAIRELYECTEAKHRFSECHVDDEVTMVKLDYTFQHQRLTAYGFGRNKKDAQRSAAKLALRKLKSEC